MGKSEFRMGNPKNRWYYNVMLLISILLFISISLLTGDQFEDSIIVSVCSSLMLLAATYTIRNRSRRLIYVAFGVILLRESTQYLLLNNYIDSIASLAITAFFLYIVYHLVRQVARSQEVNLDVILESINGYLLVGLSGSVLLALVYRIQENSFEFSADGSQQLSDFIYYGFITLTTIGYGEITPLSGMARLLSIFTGIGGQLYLAIIIATLVGKYLSQQTSGR